MPIINNKILNGHKIQDIISSLTLCEQKNRCKAFTYRPCSGFVFRIDIVLFFCIFGGFYYAPHSGF